MNHLVKSIDLGDGYIGRIYHDPDVEQPYSDDVGVKIVILHGRYIDPSKGSCGTTPDEVQRWEKRHTGWFTLPLWLYDHSGTCYRPGDANPFHCPWDSGRVGIIALRKKDWGRDEAKLRQSAEQVCSSYTDWANGECFYYTLSNEHDEEIDSCGGYIGLEDVEAALRETYGEFVKAV